MKDVFLVFRLVFSSASMLFCSITCASCFSRPISARAWAVRLRACKQALRRRLTGKFDGFEAKRPGFLMNFTVFHQVFIALSHVFGGFGNEVPQRTRLLQLCCEALRLFKASKHRSHPSKAALKSSKSLLRCSFGGVYGRGITGLPAALFQRRLQDGHHVEAKIF